MQAVIDVDEDDLVSMRLQINYTNVGHVILLVNGPHCFIHLFRLEGNVE